MLRARAMRLALALLLSACAAKTAATKVRAKDYYVLETGTIWVYKANYLGNSQTRTVVMGPKQDGFYVDDAGGKLQYDGEGLRDERRYLLKEPISGGETWTSVAALGATETYTITKAHEPCKTSTLQFDDCVEVKSTMEATERDGRAIGTLENTMVFAKQTGLVRLHTVLIRGEQRTPQVDMELTEMKRAKP